MVCGKFIPDLKLIWGKFADHVSGMGNIFQRMTIFKGCNSTHWLLQLSGNENLTDDSFPRLPCFVRNHLMFTYILASVAFLKTLFVSFTFLVWIILKI
uniref:Uncharacterized protein n=1 Tax=Salvator merianae TaxID=96440 RepID=A0A8D0DY93_SALMN